MTYDEIMNILAEGDTDAWITIEGGHCTYKEDPLLTIVHSEDSRDFNESWATKHPDSKAVTSEYEVRYGGSVICRKVLVSVDGGRATLPMPIIKTQVIARKDYNFAKIVAPSDLDEYIKQSNLSVEKYESF